jgi:hypothetical protein
MAFRLRLAGDSAAPMPDFGQAAAQLAVPISGIASRGRPKKRETAIAAHVLSFTTSCRRLDVGGESATMLVAAAAGASWVGSSAIGVRTWRAMEAPECAATEAVVRVPRPYGGSWYPGRDADDFKAARSARPRVVSSGNRTVLATWTTRFDCKTSGIVTRAVSHLASHVTSISRPRRVAERTTHV